MFPTACWYWLMYHLVHHSLSNQQGIQQGTALYGYHLLFLVPLLHSICPWCEATEFHSPELYNFPSRKEKHHSTAGQLGEASSLLDCPPITSSRSDQVKRLNLLARRQSHFLHTARRERTVHAHTDRWTHTHRHVCLTGLLNKRHVGKIPGSIVSSDSKALWEIRLAKP